MSLTDTFENRVLTWLLSSDAVTRPVSWYLGLSSVDPTDTGADTPPVDPAYARVAISFSIAGGVASNSGALTFPEATQSQGQLTHGVVYDAPTGGNMIAHGPLRNSEGVLTPITVESGQIVRVPAGAFTLTAD